MNDFRTTHGSPGPGVWLDPKETNAIANANSRQQIRKLTEDGLIIRKPVTVHSQAQRWKNTLARRKGRDMGTGKRKGTTVLEMPEKVTRMRRTWHEYEPFTQVTSADPKPRLAAAADIPGDTTRLWDTASTHSIHDIRSPESAGIAPGLEATVLRPL
ncbi:60S ribosomal protein L19 [Tupaia chinensis]|uniref:Large ribosomal subunit protein eL19 n=1 Tax=Tupaia chinensis TaxID=246437 RepID=L9KPF8_TUPCH|nr:60S ribosomal protein L19 [Tupaia chinensis]